MTFSQRKFLVLTTWVATVATVGIMFAVDQPKLWMLVACIALLPAVVCSWLWEAPVAPRVATVRSRS